MKSNVIKQKVGGNMITSYVTSNMQNKVPHWVQHILGTLPVPPQKCPLTLPLSLPFPALELC